MKRFRLELVNGDKAETVFEGGADKPVGIGRSQSNAVTLRDPSVSKRHAAIEEGPDGLRIRDTGSLNGTKRGGEKVSAEGVILADGDQLHLGKTLLRFSLLDAKASPPPPRPPQPTPPPPKRRDEPMVETFGPYGIIRPLDAHGTEVHLAVDSRTEARVALKRMPSSRFGWFGVKTFVRACEAARGLRHENLVAPCDVGKQGNTIYVAFPYVAGVTVEDILRDTPRAMGIDLAVHVAHEVSRGLAHLEQDKAAAGRPEVSDRRVMVGAAGQVVLLGAGVPRVPEPAGSGAAARYLAPEEDAGRKGDVRAAIFALGVLLYEMLTQEHIDAGQKTRLRGVDTVRIEVPTGVGQTTMRSMKVRPEARYDTAAELEAELGEALEELKQGYGVEEVRRWLVRHYPDLKASA